MIVSNKLFLTAAALALGVCAGSATATAAPFNAASPSAAKSAGTIVDVGWKRDRRYRRYSHSHRHHRHQRYVEAPYTDVDTYRGTVDVDAPYASVRRSRRGVHVRAPFVDIYIPR